MKTILSLLFALLPFLSVGQTSYQEWEQQAKTNIRLLPKYGNVTKTPEQLKSDQAFIDETMQMEQFKGNKTAASNHMIQLGFNYLYTGDLKTAMYRFNQAYLLDEDNAGIYWGYSAVFMALSQYEKAKEHYETGLRLSPKNTNLLTDYGTYFLAKYYETRNTNAEAAQSYIEQAIRQLLFSYEQDQKDQNTLYKLSICHLMNQDCKQAKKFLALCKEEGGKPITLEFVLELAATCD